MSYWRGLFTALWEYLPMQVKARSYPHPVLSYFSDDVTGSQFQSTVAVKGTKTAYVFDITAKTSNRDLHKLIGDGQARYAVHVECAPTRYRSLFADQAERFRFEIPASAIDGRVEVCSFILAVDGLPMYTNKSFHSDYQGISFKVQKGDTLAVAADATFIAEKKIDPLRKIPSIFVVVPNESDDAPAMDLDTDGHKIRISLSKANYQAYTYLRQAQPLHSSLNAMVIAPALVAVLESIRRAATTADGLASFESRRWYSVLGRRLKELGIDPNSPDSFAESTPALANRLIGEPLSDGLQSLKSYEEPEEEVS
jgi:hypothetical protein